MKIPAFLSLALFLCGCGNSQSPAVYNPAVQVASTPSINYAVVSYLPHDTNSFTEGLFVHNGQLFESTGHPPGEGLPQTRSLFGIVNMQTGIIDVKGEIDKLKYFGEGIAIIKNQLYQLTLSTNIGFIYDATTFKKLRQFSFANKEGWGLTTDGKDLMMSDGTGTLTWLDPVTLKNIKTLRITNNGIPADSLNELEYIRGYIYANVWLSGNIVKIDTASGKVVGVLDLSSLNFEAKSKYPNALEMNGIAYDEAADKIYVTGKLWPNIYQIAFTH